MNGWREISWDKGSIQEMGNSYCQLGLSSACSAAYLSSHRFNKLDNLGSLGVNTKDITGIY
jgi:hypothetical protein